MRSMLKLAASALGLTVLAGCATQSAETGSTKGWERPFEVAESVYPFESHIYRWNGYAYHYLDVPPAPGVEYKGTVLAIHGNAVWSMIYRKIVEPLSQAGYRVIATDQLGYGLSDKPDAAEFDYMPHSHAEVLADFISDLDLKDLYLVLQDWGGPIGLGAGLQAPERVNGLVIINTWAWRLPDIEDGETAFMHAVHDRGVHAASAPDFYVNGELIRRGGLGVAKRNAKEGEELFTDLRNAVWVPYLKLEDPYPLLYPGVTDSVHLSAMATVKDGDFLDGLNKNLAPLRAKPVYFAFGDDTAFGPYKVDTGFLGGPRKLCMDGYKPASDEINQKTNCVDEKTGEPYWYPLERFMSAWQSDQIVGVWKNPDVGHWVQDEAPATIVDAVIAVQKFVENNK